MISFFKDRQKRKADCVIRGALAEGDRYQVLLDQLLMRTSRAETVRVCPLGGCGRGVAGRKCNREQYYIAGCWFPMLVEGPHTTDRPSQPVIAGLFRDPVRNALTATLKGQTKE